ncbi:iron uptake porin [Dolichospermum sp. UHCC 0259]|uniref:iron uptake porin n=1 Tax=Dolichospermum sp. UHCC 0259 TaxID=2590010 RepID=UPI001447F616|nr:iron uptake porin [Dolichospermum sp. UHCC 0259]MTJ47644.1 carbohydrate porin [Dolichospermum sp. UHCC 0259]
MLNDILRQIKPLKTFNLMKLIDLPKISLIAVIAATINPIQVNADPIIASEEQEISQSNSVSQLRDVEPKDWAYEALKSLVEKYECIQGNSQGFYLGNRSITRYEFAAGLNTCLEKITQLIATEEAIPEEDLSKIKQLQTQFSSELTALSTRLDSIENRILPLEAEQFSTTTKLSGTTWINLTGVSTGDNIKFEALPNTPFDNRFIGGRDGTGKPLVDTISDSKTTLSSLTWLTLNTSFTGKDILKVQLAAGNGASPINQFASAGFFNTYGSPFTDQT